MDDIKQTTIDASLDNIAEIWVKILLSHIQSKKAEENLTSVSAKEIKPQASVREGKI